MGLDGGKGSAESFVKKFNIHNEFYNAPPPQNPVIIVLDNDSGFSNFQSILKKINSATIYPTVFKKDEYRKADFIHVMHNPYIVLTPLSPKGKQTDIEYLFDDATRLTQHNGKCFNTADKRDDETDLSKEAFADHIIKTQKGSINFDGLKPLLDRIVAAITHYDSIK